MSRSSRILKNVASNWVGFAVNAVVTLLLTPFVLHELGDGRYGIWVLMSSIIGYYGMLDLGFRAGVNQYLTRSVAVSDYELSSAVLSTAFVALSLVAAVMGVLTIGAAYLAPVVFNLPEGTVSEAFWCIMSIGFAASVQCLLSPFSSIFVALQRFDISNLIGISARLLTAVLVVLALRAGYGLVGVSVATASGTVLDYTTRYVVSRRLAPHIKATHSRASYAQMRTIGAFGLWNFLIAFSQYVYLHVQPLIVAIFLPVSAVGYYALAAGLWTQINALFGPIGQVIYPAVAELDATGETTLLKQLYADGTRLLMLVVVPIVAIAFVWATEFYNLWIGDTYTSGEAFTSVATLLRVLLVATVLGYSTNIGGQLLLGGGHVRDLAIVKGLGALITLGSSIFLTAKFGLLGIASSILLATILTDTFAIPYLVHRRMGLPILVVLAKNAGRIVAIALLLVTADIAIATLIVTEGWISLMTQGAMAGAIAVFAVILLGLTKVERSRFIYSNFQRLAGWRK